MPHQSEQQLENQLVKQLNTLGFKSVVLPDQESLVANLKTQLERFNKTTFSAGEFKKILNHLNKGDRFQKAHTLRDRFLLKRDDESDFYVRFFNMDYWCKNEYQVARQITQEGSYKNRYDVTLLINGLPLVQIELKRRGVELKEAFNQIRRYHRHSFSGTLFEYVQIFVISNGVNTKYFANNPNQNFAQTFFWTDEKNRKITRLTEFAEEFLEKCFLSQFIGEYIVLAEVPKIPMVLRPYQYYAVRAIEKRVKETDKNGYIWHTTGSGKTLTSFKTSQILSRMPEIKKVLFVVDRKDLDIQTTKEFNSFSAGSVDGTTNTRNLVRQLKDPNRKLIVTTIQKLDRAVSRETYLEQFTNLQDERLVIIFDECHRSQFGLVHKHIREFFRRAQLFGFTGTPIFADNNVGGVTTKDVFHKALHKYTITHAISDNNVLGFVVEYVGRYRKITPDVVSADIVADSEDDELVEGIDIKEVLEADKRLEKISDYILMDWRKKTKKGLFNAIFATPSIRVLKKYYRFLKEKKPVDFKLATIFTYQANEEMEDNLDLVDVSDIDLSSQVVGEVRHSREFLEGCIKDYNQQFGTNFSTSRFYDYYKDLQKRIKAKQVDLVLVVSMLLTGFDSPRTNTLYLDKNLRYHGLIQAYSRTNRLLDANKPHGNIVVFRNLKKATDEALTLFGDESAKEVVFKEPYEKQKEKFKVQLKHLKTIAPTVDVVDELRSEKEKAEFVKTFRELLRIKASLETFAEFSFEDVGIAEQEFYDFQSKYLDIYEERKKSDPEKVSVIDEIDFELELTVKNVIDFDYIIQLIAGLREIKSSKLREKKTEEILSIFDRDVRLRKKKDLIEKFIKSNLPQVKEGESVKEAFDKFWASERSRTLKELAKKEGIKPEKLEQVISEYLYTQKLPRQEEIVHLLPSVPPILERKSIITRIQEMIENIVNVFEW